MTDKNRSAGEVAPGRYAFDENVSGKGVSGSPAPGKDVLVEATFDKNGPGDDAQDFDDAQDIDGPCINGLDSGHARHRECIPRRGHQTAGAPGEGPDAARKSAANGTGGRSPRGRQAAGRRTNITGKKPSDRRKNNLYAALDLGTNNCRLLIVRREDRGFRVIDGFTRIVRLGEGLSQTGMLNRQAMERTYDALALCASKLSHHAPKKYRLIATQACRQARNAGEFLQRVKNDIGMDVEVIDQKTEASLAVTGCSDLIEKSTRGALLFDIGGGSSELAWLDFRGGRPRQNSKLAAAIRSWQSLPFGVVTIAEKFGGTDVSPEKFEEMVAYVARQLRHFRGSNKLKQMIRDHPVHLIGTSGTVTTLAGLHLGLQRYDRSKVDGLWMNSEQLTDTMRVLQAMPHERRMANPCIGRDRASLIIPGCAIFEAIRREWPTERVRIADRGLREGILISLIEEDRAKTGRFRHGQKGQE